MKRHDLKNSYPRSTKDELKYYASQFNYIELNATHHRNFSEDHIQAWCDKTPDYFRFFPKVNRQISQLRWLNHLEEPTDQYLASVVHFREKLATIFQQCQNKSDPNCFGKVVAYVK